MDSDKSSLYAEAAPDSEGLDTGADEKEPNAFVLDAVGELSKPENYRVPTLECDMVMKGGITSGVVYPHAICQIARRYRFKNVGGSSAGAIAAAAGAAAELGRNSANGGFHHLATLPNYLGAHLADLFQPSPATAPYFRLFLFWLGHKDAGPLTWIRKAPKDGLGVTRHLVVGAIALAIVVLSPFFLLWLNAPLWATALSPVAFLFLWFALKRGLLAALSRARAAILANGFGLCTGLGNSPQPPPPAPPRPDGRTSPNAGYALTNFLDDELRQLAGRVGTDPLTFGDLNQAGIKLEMFTTNLTNGRAHRLPFRASVSGNTDGLFFDPTELQRYFPSPVVAWMVDHQPAPTPGVSSRDREEWNIVCELMADHGLKPLPDWLNLPVIVATRMSLSFPVLFSAVPLYKINWTDPTNSQARKSWRAGLREGTERVIKNLKLEPARCWFSDGGISSNFPIHFFDSPLPTRPTFGINLAGTQDANLPTTPAARVVLHNRTTEGLDLAWTSIEDLGSFGLALFDTLHEWQDNAQMRVQGFWDRVAHVVLTPEEGGLNLTMSTQMIDNLTEWGRHAGARLSARFDPGTIPSNPHQPTWDRHRWGRLRTLLVHLEGLARQTDDAFVNPGQGLAYDALLNRMTDDPATGYWWPASATATQGQQTTASFRALTSALGAAKGALEGGAPRPFPKLRSTPPI